MGIHVQVQLLSVNKVRQRRSAKIGFAALAFAGVIAAESFAQTDQLDQWHVRRELPQLVPRLPDSLLGVTFGNGLWAWVGMKGTILTTPDPESTPWTIQTSGTQNNLNCVLFANGMFVVVGAGGTILTSTDGTQWTPQISGTVGSINNVIYADGQFVAVGEAGLVLSSPDGVTWKNHPTGIQGWLSAIAYGNGRYVIPNSSLSIWHSTDLDSWKSVSTSETGFVGLRGATYHDGLFVTVGQSSAIFTSSNGVNWVKRVGDTQSMPPFYSAVIYAGGSFIAVGGAGGIQQSKSVVVTSPDGKTWTERETTGKSFLNSVAAGNGRVVAVGGGFPMANTVLTSRDGVSWTDFSETPRLSAVLFANDSFVAAGDNGLILTSADGVLWQQRQTGTTAHLNDLVFDGRALVAVGTSGTILRSNDGINWSSQTSHSRVHLTGATTGKGLFVVVGGDQIMALDGTLAATPRALLSSSDGITWTDHPNVSLASFGEDDAPLTASRALLSVSPSRPPQPPTTSGALYDVAFGNGRFVAVGGGQPSIQPSSQTIFRSDDGLVWKGRAVLYPPVLRGITFGNGLFVAVGDGRTVSISADGVGFNQIFPAGSSVLHKIGFASGIFAMVGANGYLATSTTGTNWTTRQTRSTRGLRGIAFGKGTFVAVGDSGVILQSDPQPPADVPRLTNATHNKNGSFSASVQTVRGWRYTLEFTSDLAEPSWNSLPSVEGDGSVRLLSDPASGLPNRFYRLRLE